MSNCKKILLQNNTYWLSIDYFKELINKVFHCLPLLCHAIPV